MLAAVSSRVHLALILALASVSSVGAAAAWAQERPAAGAADPAVTQAGQWLAEGRAGEAWQLLAPLEAAHPGDTEFDYLLALAALQSGRAPAALAPLRRILALEPRFDGARLELARALAASGDAAGARQQFEWLLQRSPSATSHAAATRELATLAGAAPDAVKHQVVALLAGAGFDSNANAATSDAVFGFTLDPRTLQQSSVFVEAGASLQGSYALAPRLGLVTLLRAAQRLNPQARFVDQTALAAGFGVNARLGSWTAGVAANLASGWLDGEPYFRSGWLEASASRPIAADWEVVAVGRAITLDYRPDRFGQLDVRRYVWGGALQRRSGSGGVPTIGVAVLGGRDDARATASPWSNDRYGMRLFGARALGARTVLAGDVSWLTSDFFGARGFLGLDRLDRQFVAAVGLETREWPAPGWRLAPQVRYTDSRSNVALFRFDRFEASVFLRREFD